MSLEDESPNLSYFERKRLIEYGHIKAVDEFVKKNIE